MTVVVAVTISSTLEYRYVLATSTGASPNSCTSFLLGPVGTKYRTKKLPHEIGEPLVSSNSTGTSRSSSVERSRTYGQTQQYYSSS
jgi:hypothetical protein